MKFVEFDFRNYNHKYKKYQNDMKSLLQSINDMHLHCIEIQDFTWANVKIGQTGLLAAIKKYGFNNLRPCIRTIDGVERLFVINTEVTA